MLTILSQKKDVKDYSLQSFPHPVKQVYNDLPEEKQLESSSRYRDAIISHLWRFRKYVHKADLPLYYIIMNEMLDLSFTSAIHLLQNLYEYQVRKLQPSESRKEYPGISNELYRLEYDDERGVYRDVCAETLLNEAIDLLKTEAERLIRQRGRETEGIYSMQENGM
jgi:hypothetical protein